MIHFFCPGCWIEVDEAARCCERCGYDLSAYQDLSFEDKLLLALRDPIRETQRMAVYLLGRLGSERALSAFEELLASSEDPYLLREVVQALSRIPLDGSMRLMEGACRHPSTLVSEAARAMIEPLSRLCNGSASPGSRHGA